MFPGFPKETISFLRALKRNNRREWFEKRRPHYEEVIVAPSKAFAEAMRAPLHKLNPNLRVGPKSIGRIYRDTRFSSDKKPYKTYLSFNFRDQRGDKDFTPSFYMGLDHTGIVYGGGIFGFSTLQRDYFRNRVLDDVAGDRLAEIVKKLRRDKRFSVKGSELKKMPKGFDLVHPNAEFLLHNGLYVSHEEDLPKAFNTGKFVAHATQFFSEIQPLMAWLGEFSRSVPKGLERFLDN
jgi:uncharacterized protein (TIGR02453 family)